MAPAREVSKGDLRLVDILEGEDQSLTLRGGYYSLAFLAYMRNNQGKYGITKRYITKSFSNCFAIFFMQAFLTFLVGVQFFTAVSEFTSGTYPVMLTRFICGIMLHLSMEA